MEKTTLPLSRLMNNRKLFEKKKKNYFLVSLALFFFSVTGIFLYLDGTKVLGIFTTAFFILLAILVLVIGLTYNINDYNKEVLKATEKDFKKILPQILNNLSIYILYMSGENLARKIFIYNNPLIKELELRYNNNQRFKDLITYFNDESIISFIIVLERILYNYKKDKINLFIDNIDKILRTYTKSLAIKIQDIKRSAENQSTIIVTFTSFLNVIAFGIISIFFYPKYYNPLFGFLSAFALAFFVGMVSFLIIKMISSKKERIYD